MTDPYQAIVNSLQALHVEYEELDHAAVYTSKQAAAIRGLSLQQGAKSLLLKTDHGFVLVVLPGDKKLDSKKLKKVAKTKGLRFATPEEVKEIMGCEIGACYPFGNLINIAMVVDPSLGANELISFNPGMHTKSIKMHWEEYERAVHPNLVEIAI